MFSAASTRMIFRWTHLIMVIPVIGYTYSPFENLPDYAPVVRFIAIPVITVTGLWMWKGHLLCRLFAKRSEA